MENSNQHDNLTVEELVHLAIKASKENRHDNAIQYLKRAMINNQDPVTLYLLAAEHAEIGMYEQAIGELTQVISNLPDLWPARIQLALLKILTNNISPPALECLQPLIQLPEDNCYHHFAQGLEMLTNTEYEKGILSLQKGITLNSELPPLNRDMQNLIGQIQEKIDGKKPQAEETPKNNHLFINAYNNTSV